MSLITHFCLLAIFFVASLEAKESIAPCSSEQLNQFREFMETPLEQEKLCEKLDPTSDEKKICSCKYVFPAQVKMAPKLPTCLYDGQLSHDLLKKTIHLFEKECQRLIPDYTKETQYPLPSEPTDPVDTTSGNAIDAAANTPTSPTSSASGASLGFILVLPTLFFASRIA